MLIFKHSKNIVKFALNPKDFYPQMDTMSSE